MSRSAAARISSGVKSAPGHEPQRHMALLARLQAERTGARAEVEGPALVGQHARELHLELHPRRPVERIPGDEQRAVERREQRLAAALAGLDGHVALPDVVVVRDEPPLRDRLRAREVVHVAGVAGGGGDHQHAVVPVDVLVGHPLERAEGDLLAVVGADRRDRAAGERAHRPEVRRPREPGSRKAVEAVHGHDAGRRRAAVLDLHVHVVRGVRDRVLVARKAVRRVSVPHRRVVPVDGLERVLALAAVVDVDVDGGRVAAVGALLLERPPDDLLVDAARDALRVPVLVVGGLEVLAPQLRAAAGNVRRRRRVPVARVRRGRQVADRTQDQVGHEARREPAPAEVVVVPADRPVDPEVAGREDLLGAVGAVVVGASPRPRGRRAVEPPLGGEGAERRIAEPLGERAQRRLGVHLQRRKPVACAVAEAERAAADVVAQRAVSSHLVPVHPRVHRAPERLRGVREVTEREAHVIGPARAVRGPVGIDGGAHAAVVDGDRERRPVEVIGDHEAEVLHRPEQLGHVVVGVDGGEVVRADREVEVRAGGARRRRDHRALLLLDHDEVADQALRPAGRRIEGVEQLVGVVQREDRLAVVGGDCEVAGRHHRVAPEDHPVDALGQALEVEDGPALDLDERQPDEAREARHVEAGDQLRGQIRAAGRDVVGHGRQLDEGRRRVLERRGLVPLGLGRRRVAPVALRRLVLVDDEAPAQEPRVVVPRGGAASGAREGLAERRLLLARRSVVLADRARRASALEQLAVAGDGLLARQLALEGGLAVVRHAQDPRRSLLDLHGHPAPEDRHVEVGLDVGDGRAVELALLLAEAVLDALLARLEVLRGRLQRA